MCHHLKRQLYIGSDLLNRNRCQPFMSSLVLEPELSARIDFQILIARAKILSLISPGNDDYLSNTVENF